MKLTVKDSNNIARACNELQDMFTQLFDNTKLNYFGYARFNADRQLSFLSSNQHFHQHYLDKSCYNDVFKHYQHDNSQYGQFFCSDITKSASENDVLELAQPHNITNTMTINRKGDTYTEIFNFGSCASANGIASMFLNNQQFINDYIDISKNSIEKLLQRYHVPNILIPAANNIDREEIHTAEQPCLSSVLAEQIKKHKKFINLTNRETSCLVHLLKGLSTTEIADQLSISKRTVENNLARLLDKLNVTSRIHLLGQLRNNYRFYPSHHIIVKL